MTYEDYTMLASEVRELELILAGIPEDRVIDRLGFESRLVSAKAAMEGIEPDRLIPKARLTFRGTPVFGSHGVAAEFAGRASGFFTDAFASIMAALHANLRYMGPIPDKQRNQLVITGTAVGSFGFEYELPSPNAGSQFEQPELDLGASADTHTAMQKMEELFRLAAEGTDEALSAVVDEIHPRAVKKVADFLDYLAEQKAWCGLDFEEGSFRFSSNSQVRRSAERLTGDNIRETTEEFSGRFEGALPTGRSFEFRLREEKTILRGKVGPAVEDPNVLNREYLYKDATIHLKAVQVGKARPRYTLATLDDIQAAP